MKFLKTPLQLGKGELSKGSSLRESIDAALTMLLNTPLGSYICDPDYGFAFTMLRFENFDENTGTVFTPPIKERDEDYSIYEKKISGTSKNLQTFAADLNTAIKQYEPRLKDTTCVMTYMREVKQIIVTIRGTIAMTDEEYLYKRIINVWN